MNKFASYNPIDDYEFSIHQVFWVLDNSTAYKIRPFVYLENNSSVGYLDDLTQDKKPNADLVLTTDMILEVLYRLTSSNKQRELLIDYDTRITVDFMLYREEILGMANLYEKFAKKYAAHHETQNTMFSVDSIEQRQAILAKTTFESTDIFWHFQDDDSSYVRPFLKLSNNRIGYLDNCQIADMPEKQNVMSGYELAGLLMSMLSENKKKENLIVNIYNQLTLPERLSQKAIARISQVYHQTAEKYAKNKMILDNAFNRLG